MEIKRINITPNAIKLLPVTINDTDYDIEINTRDFAFCNFVLSMCDDVMKLQKKVTEVCESKNLEAMRNVANEALDKAEECYNQICQLIPHFGEITLNKPIRDFSVWCEFLGAMSELISEGKASQSVEEAIRDEESGVLGV